MLTIAIQRFAMAGNDLSAARFHAWQHEYEAVLYETDGVALFKRVEVAQSAILIRRENLRRNPDDQPELRAIEEALANLRRIKIEKLKFL